MPRASVRSVLTGMALNAARTWRVSSSSTAKPAAFIPAKSHCDKGPASRPILAIGVPCAANQAISASGSLATLACFRILPCASTMHTLALSNDTSMPAYCSMVVPPDVGAGKSPPPLFNTINVRDHQSPERLGSTPARYPIYDGPWSVLLGMRLGSAHLNNPRQLMR